MTLDDILRTLEDDDDVPSPNTQQIDIILQPPTNACQDLTDEDSGDEDLMNIDNLPGPQLRAEAEIFNHNEEGGDEDEEAEATDEQDEDNLPLRSFQIAMKKNYLWEEKDLESQAYEWPAYYDVKTNLSPTELFIQFFDENVINMFVKYSKLYAARKNNVDSNITAAEMRAFFGILILSGYVQLPRRRMFWENSKDCHNELVSTAMSRDRFEFIMSHLHCCDNYKLSQTDRFAKVRPLFEVMNRKFQDFCPSRATHSVDEPMVPYFGRHGCKQFIKGKPIRYGFKVWMGAISSSDCAGYCVWLEPYQGANTQISSMYKPFGLGPSIVLHYSSVLRQILPLPYHIFFDNFFTTVPLLEELLRHNIRGTGTVRENRMSKCTVQTKTDMKKTTTRGTFEYRSTGNKVLIVKWNDNNIVNVATNNLQVYPIQHASRVQKKKIVTVEIPQCIKVYNAFMGGVDRCDENISYYRTSIRGKKWYSCLIFYILDLAVQNSWHLHRLQGGSMDQLTFRRQIAMTLLETNRVSRKRGRPSQLENAESRFMNTNEHYLVRQDKPTRCRVCHKPVQKRCYKCDVALHMDCFLPYHTKN